MENKKQVLIIGESGIVQMPNVGAQILIPADEIRKREGLIETARAREQLRRDDALDVLRKAADDPNADPRELLALTMKVDPYLVRHELPNRKQRRQEFHRASHKLVKRR